jgi:hypothetical protein
VSDISSLKAAGMDIDALPSDQQEALARLDPTEVAALVSIREKLNEEPDVSGHIVSGLRADGNLVW